MSNKIRKTVSFNIKNENDQEYLKRIEGVNFSGYVKKLIEKDIRSRKIIKADNTPAQQYSGIAEIRINGQAVIPAER